MAVLASKKNSSAPVNKAPEAVVEKEPVEVKKAPTKKGPKEKKVIDLSQMKTVVPKPIDKQEKKVTVYHVSKRDNDGREWKVFIQESSKVIKLFDTQDEALKYAKGLCSNKADGSYVVLHGLNGKIRKF